MSVLKVDQITNQNDDGPVIISRGIIADGSQLTLKPTTSSFLPTQLSTNVGIDTSIQIGFSQTVEFLGVGTIYIREGSSSGSITTYFTCGVSTEASITGGTLTINPRNSLTYGTTYFVTLPSTGIANTLGSYTPAVDNYQFETEYSTFDIQGGDYEQVVVAPTSPTGYYKYNIFTSSGIATFTAPSSTATDFAYVLVGGGGGGGAGWDSNHGGSGGGGAGGVVYNYNSNNLPLGSYTVTIGSGGSGAFDNPGGTAAPPTITPSSSGVFVVTPTNGGDSSFGPSPVGTIIAYGGGAGGSGALREGPAPSWPNSTYYYNTQPGGFAPPPAHTWVAVPVGYSPNPTAPLGVLYPMTNLGWVGGGAPGGSGGGSAGAGSKPPTYYYSQVNYTRISVTGAPGTAYPSPTQQGYPGGPFNTSYTPGGAISGTGGGGAGGSGGAGGIVQGPGDTAGPVSGGNGKPISQFPGPGLQLIPGFPTILAAELGPSGLVGGGGGGGFYGGSSSIPTSYGSGGPGGGGTGASYIPGPGFRNASRGVENTGGGGGGGRTPGGPTGVYPTPAPGNWVGQNGGSGIMMIRYAHPGA